MKHKKHRLGVSEARQVVRRLRLEPNSNRNVTAAVREIDGLYGIDEVSVDAATRVIHLAYDASRLSIDGIEQILKRHGLEVSHDWWTHFKEGHYRFVDQNIKDNAAHVPHCCNKTPPNVGRK